LFFFSSFFKIVIDSVLTICACACLIKIRTNYIAIRVRNIQMSTLLKVQIQIQITKLFVEHSMAGIRIMMREITKIAATKCMGF
jgi:hypothetical protein